MLDETGRVRPMAIALFVVCAWLAVGVFLYVRRGPDRERARAAAIKPEASVVARSSDSIPEPESRISRRGGPKLSVDGEELPAFGAYVYVEQLPEAIKRVPPEYPLLARQANVEGTVIVQALIGKDGRVKDTRVAQSVPMLDDAAVTAVSQWVFKPAMARQKPVAVWVAVPVRFTLR